MLSGVAVVFETAFPLPKNLKSARQNTIHSMAAVMLQHWKLFGVAEDARRNWCLKW
jgi:hypothetical protein